MDVDVEILLFGLFCSYAAVATMVIQASLTTMVVAATIAVYGLSFFFSFVAVAAETMVDVSNLYNIQNGDGIPRRLFYFLLCLS